MIEPLPPAGRYAPYASLADRSRGRYHAEPSCPTRTPFQRDRDRIIHSTAFRRLTYKTQVFIYHEGDHYRTRLTHSLEVAQIARAIARTLKLDEDLAEAVALAHDLGHTPFGHAGERALNAVMGEYGGFDHNAQSLRIVTALEKKYAEFDGLNLTWETLEGIVKHNGPLLNADGTAKKGTPEKDLPVPIAKYSAQHDLALSSYPSLEAQIAAIADDIAYNNHDIDDGLRAGLITFDQLNEIPMTKRIMEDIYDSHGTLSQPRRTYEINRRMITAMVNDVVSETTKRLAALAPCGSSSVRDAPQTTASFSLAMAGELDEIRAFLRRHVYRHPRVMDVMTGAESIVADLFSRYLRSAEDLPQEWRALLEGGGAQARACHVCDFVAGMTDRYAIREHRRLFDATPELR